MATLFVGTVVAILVLAHLTVLWPAFLAFAITLSAVGIYRAYESYEEKKQKLSAEADETAIETEKSISSDEIELTTFSASSEVDEINGSGAMTIAVNRRY